MQAREWKELQAKYEEEKKKDPTSPCRRPRSSCPSASPKIVWQKGKEKWHVDAPVAVVGDKVLVASAFLDKEKVGDRAVFCLDAETGEERLEDAAEAQPVGRAVGRRRHGHRHRQHHRLRPEGAQGREGRRRRVRPGERQGEVAKEIPGGVLGCAAIADGARGRHRRPTARCGRST